MENHYNDVLMYRMTKEATKNKGRLRYKEKGYDLVVMVPMTEEQKLSGNIKDRMETISGKKIMIQGIPGQTVVSKMTKTNPCPPLHCHRKDCIPCQHGSKDSECYTNNIGYVIVCSRSPCTDNI